MSGVKKKQQKSLYSTSKSLHLSKIKGLWIPVPYCITEPRWITKKNENRSSNIGWWQNVVGKWSLSKFWFQLDFCFDNSAQVNYFLAQVWLFSFWVISLVSLNNHELAAWADKCGLAQNSCSVLPLTCSSLVLEGAAFLHVFRCFPPPTHHPSRTTIRIADHLNQVWVGRGERAKTLQQSGPRERWVGLDGCIQIRTASQRGQWSESCFLKWCERQEATSCPKKVRWAFLVQAKKKKTPKKATNNPEMLSTCPKLESTWNWPLTRKNVPSHRRHLLCPQ